MLPSPAWAVENENFMKLLSNPENEGMANPIEPGFEGESEEGERYVCQRCTNCCRWPGQVSLGEWDLVAISGYLGMSEWDFIQQFTRLQSSRMGLALTEKADGACVFLEGNDCRIQAVKPRQCRDFPNGWNFPGWREVCEAIPVSLVGKGDGKA